MNRLTAMRVLEEYAVSLRERLDHPSYAETIKLFESRIDAVEKALEDMQRLEGLEK